MRREFYISVDVESSGPIPGKYSMLSLGACAVADMERSFYIELKPISMEFVPKALEVSGFDLAQLVVTGEQPAPAMKRFRHWVEATAGNDRPIFVGFNACYDWQFVNWYLESFAEGNPFGFGGIDIKSYYMGASGLQWANTTSRSLPPSLQPDVHQTHNALDDAKAQASIFAKLLARKA